MLGLPKPEPSLIDLPLQGLISEWDGGYMRMIFFSDICTKSYKKWLLSAGCDSAYILAACSRKFMRSSDYSSFFMCLFESFFYKL
jgi:hypothetical protein